MSSRLNHQPSRVKKILIWAGLLVIISGVFSLVYAYFTGISVAQALTLQTAHLAIEASAPVTDHQPLLPGETQFATWEIKNTGDVAQHFKFKLEKTLIESGDAGALKIIALAYEDGTDWTQWLADEQGLEREIFWSPTGAENELKTLLPGDSVKIKVSYKLDAQTADQMQNKSWQIKLHTAAKQIGLTASWPASY